MTQDRPTIVFGALGMLGSALLRRLAARHVSVRGLDRDELDLADSGALETWLGEHRPSAVFNAAAYNDVNGAEEAAGERQAIAVNREAPAALARACRGLDVPFVHVSTDYVFDGRTGRPYREEDETGPLQVYGRSKLAGERAALSTWERTLVVRTSTVFGAAARPRANYVDAILEQAREGGPLAVVEPPVSSPTWAEDLAGWLLALAQSGATGLVHAVNGGRCSRLELARAVVEEAGLSGRVEIGRRDDPGTGAPRPAFSVLDTSRLEALLGYAPRPWREALRAYLRGH